MHHRARYAPCVIVLRTIEVDVPADDHKKKIMNYLHHIFV
jgi:hypothetical protein